MQNCRYVEGKLQLYTVLQPYTVTNGPHKQE